MHSCVPSATDLGASNTTAEIGNFYYGPGHPMKPHRIRMCHNLLLNYRVYEKMDVFVSAQTFPSKPPPLSSVAPGFRHQSPAVPPAK